MVKKRKRPQIVVGRFVMDGSVITDPQTVAMTERFTKDSQTFLDRLQILRETIQSQLEWNAGGWRWNPPEPFNIASFAGDATRVYEAWNAARHENSKLDAFNGNSFQSLVRLFGLMTVSETVPEDLVSTFHGFRDEVERMDLRLSVSKPDKKKLQLQENVLPEFPGFIEAVNRLRALPKTNGHQSRICRELSNGDSKAAATLRTYLQNNRNLWHEDHRQ